MVHEALNNFVDSCFFQKITRLLSRHVLSVSVGTFSNLEGNHSEKRHI